MFGKVRDLLGGRSKRKEEDQLIHERLAELDENQAETMEALARETGSERVAQRARELRRDIQVLRLQLEVIERGRGGDE